MVIRTADSDSDRQRVHDFLAKFLRIAHDAIPSTANDRYYTPLIPFVVDDQDTIIAAALSCRAQVAAGAAFMGQDALAHPIARRYVPLLDKHSELDLLAVDPDYRGHGLASQLVTWLEARLVDRGIRTWFGNATEDLDVDLLRRFYQDRGFTVTELGQPLPPLLGVEWAPPGVDLPAFFFYKRPKAIVG